MGNTNYSHLFSLPHQKMLHCHFTYLWCLYLSHIPAVKKVIIQVRLARQRNYTSILTTQVNNKKVNFSKKN